MKFQLNFMLKEPFFSTRDYRRVFTSIIKSALSEYREGEKFEKYYNASDQKDFTWCVLFNKPKFGKEYISLEGCDVRMILSTYDRKNTAHL